MPRSMRSLLARIAALAVIVVVAAACTKTLDTEGLEGELLTQIEEQVGTTITSIDCPTDIEAETGRTFECTAEEESGATFTIQVTQSDDQGHVEWELTDAAPA